MIYRKRLSAEAMQSGAGNSNVTDTLTATQPILIVGWCMACKVVARNIASVNANVEGGFEISRSLDFQAENYVVAESAGGHYGVQNIGGTDHVGLMTCNAQHLERYLTDQEAEELGLLLAEGESIHIQSQCVVTGLALGSVHIHGIIFYKQVDGVAQFTNHKARAYPSSAQTITKAVETKLTLDTEDYDPGNHFAGDKYTVTKAGYYLLTGQVAIVDLANAKRLRVSIYKNGTPLSSSELWMGAAGTSTLAISDIQLLAVDDEIELYVRHDDIENRDTSPSNCWLSIHLLSGQ